MRIPLLLPLLGAVALSGCSKSSPTEPPPPSGYVLVLRWLGTPPDTAISQSFAKAVARSKTIIVGAVTPVALPAAFTNVSQCDPNDPNLSGFPDVPRDDIQGLVIYALIDSIDGPGGVLGSAGPCLVRQGGDSRPALGIMRFDEADLQGAADNNRLDPLILHEMLHVIGIGTIWRDKRLLTGDSTADARFIGARARTACSEFNGGTTTCATSVPVHSMDGEGSAYSHWRETTFTNELMTPMLSSGTAPLSAMSIQSLADLGYEVSAVSADPFRLTAGLMAADARDSSAPAGVLPTRVLPTLILPTLILPEPSTPRFRISARGGLVPFEQPQ